MNGARIRIARVKMKAGGADLRVLDRNPDSRIIKRITDLAADGRSYAEPPSAFVGILFWRDDAEPWRPSYSVAWDTIDPNLPLPRLMRVASDEIAAHGSMVMTEDKVLRRLGYVRNDDPDPAA